jgi:hypothetical protein
VDVLEVDDSDSGFSVGVLGQSATVTMTLTLSSGLLVAECFDEGNEVPIGAVEPPNRLVLEVVQEGFYTCRYGSGCAGPSEPMASVSLYASTEDFDVSRQWTISVTGGRAVSTGCSPRTISTFSLRPDPKIPGLLFGAFLVEPFGVSATVDITAPRPRGGGAIVAAQCEDQDSDGRLRDVLVPPNRLVFDVLVEGLHTCYVEGRAGTAPPTVPPTDTPAVAPFGPSSRMVPTVLTVLFGVLVGCLLISLRAGRTT